MALDEINYLWEHWKFNAEQRIKAFNFFVILSIFTNGGVFTSIERCVGSLMLVCIGLFIFAVAVIFWVIDERSQKLIELPINGLKNFETTLNHKSRLFHLDELTKNKYIRFTYAFRALFIIQIIFGLSVLIYGLLDMFPVKSGIPLITLSVCK